MTRQTPNLISHSHTFENTLIKLFASMHITLLSQLNGMDRKNLSPLQWSISHRATLEPSVPKTTALSEDVAGDITTPIFEGFSLFVCILSRTQDANSSVLFYDVCLGRPSWVRWSTTY